MCGLGHTRSLFLRLPPTHTRTQCVLFPVSFCDHVRQLHFAMHSCLRWAVATALLCAVVGLDPVVHVNDFLGPNSTSDRPRLPALEDYLVRGLLRAFRLPQ